MTAQRICTAAWLIFLVYYFAAKYFVGGFTGFSVNYLVSVIVLVLLTAVFPYYASRWLASKLSGAGNVAARLVLPLSLVAGGLSLFFVVFIAPNFPTIELAKILYRAIEPAVAISVLLFLPDLLARIAPATANTDDTA